MAAIDTELIVTALLFFVVGLIISAIIIYVVTKLAGEKEGFGTAVAAALIGALIYALAYVVLNHGLLAAVIGGFFWWLALSRLYNMGMLKALGVAIIVWIMALIVGFILPTTIGPL